MQNGLSGPKPIMIYLDLCQNDQEYKKEKSTCCLKSNLC